MRRGASGAVITGLILLVAGAPVLAAEPAPVKKKPASKSATATVAPAEKKAPPPPPPPAPEPESIFSPPYAPPPSAFAPKGKAGSDDELSELLQILNTETEIATRTKLNSDYVPGMVTVLHRRDLLAKGVRTVYEALGLVPGIELSMTSDGQVQFLVRGLGKVFASTKIKFLLDGMDVNTALGPNLTVHTLPIERIERIEVIRGPGSAIYGEYALAGVVDIITASGRKDIYARYGSVLGSGVGGSYHYAPEDKQYEMSLAFDASRSDGGDVRAGEDRLYGTMWQGVSNAPGDTNESHEHHDVFLNGRYDKYRLSLQRVHVGFGDHFGVNNVLPEDSSGIVRAWTVDTARISAPFLLASGTELGVELNWMKFVGDAEDQTIWPAGFPNASTTEELYGGPHYEEMRTGVAVTLEFPASGPHKWIGGFEANLIEQGDTWNDRNFTLTATPAQIPETRATGAGNWMEEDLDRLTLSLYAQDQWSATQRLTMTMGARFDRYDDVGNAFSPRIAAVYQAAEHQIIKAQYSDSFRPPSFLEMYSKNNPIVNGNDDIDPERMQTYELGYIYNDGQSVYRLTAYVAELHDVITRDAVTRTYVNGDEADLRGIEFEVSLQPHPRLRTDGNLSLIRTDFGDGADSSWGTADLLANVSALYRVTTDRYLNVQLHRTGARARSDIDPRSDLDGYTTVDVTYSDLGTWVSKLNLRGGVRNLFDAEVTYPAEYAPQGAFAYTYEDDYPRPGRELWIGVEYEY